MNGFLAALVRLEARSSDTYALREFVRRESLGLLRNFNHNLFDDMLGGNGNEGEHA